MEKKNIAKSKILNYMLYHGNASKVELAKQLNLSMPTVLSNTSELMEKGVISEVGELESTGGRKARVMGIRKDYRYAVGIDVTAHHISMVLVDLSGSVIKQTRTRTAFRGDVTYCSELSDLVHAFIETEVPAEKILGVGVSMPGIINKRERILLKSHALQVENYSLRMLEQMIGAEVYFENDANAAMLAENPHTLDNAVYLSLNYTLGGAICMGGRLYTGESQKAGEFGHIILVPGGRTCYCGKKGCADAYCAASVLTQNGKINLDDFMNAVKTGEKEAEIWDEYLEYLAILISNIRMAYDTDIILGGTVGGYLPDYIVKLGEKIFKYNLFDRDLSYLKTCSYAKEASAVGAAKYFFSQLIESI